MIEKQNPDCGYSTKQSSRPFLSGPAVEQMKCSWVPCWSFHSAHGSLELAPSLIRQTGYLILRGYLSQRPR